MSDDLVKRLSFLADRIELGDKLRWGEDSAALRGAKDRIEELEAKLEKAADFVRRTIRYAGNSGDDFLTDKARATLAELTGDPDA